MAPDKLKNGVQSCFRSLMQIIYIQVFSVCILLVSYPLSHFNKPSPSLLQVLQLLG